MLDLKLERLLALLAAPLLAAVPVRKSQPVKKAQKKPAHAASLKRRTASAKKTDSPTRKSSRAATKPNEKPARPKKSAAHDQGTAIATAPSTKSTGGESAPKPNPPSGRAILLAPENEKFSETLHPTFRWLSVGNATRYEVAWSEEPNLTQSHSVVSIATEAAVPVEKPLRLGTTYYWHVRGGNEGGWGPWSTIVSFRVLDEATQ